MCLCILVHEVILSTLQGVTRWCSWLRHCVTSQKVAGSISDVVIKTFHFQTHYGPGVDSNPKINEYQEHFLEGGVKGKGLTALPSSCFEIWELQHPGALTACPGLYRDCFTFFTVPSVML